MTKDFLAGVMLQYDTFEASSPTSTTRGDGWMIGPYVTARLSERLGRPLATIRIFRILHTV